MTQLPKHFDSKQAEERWDQQWEQWGIHRYDPSRSRQETFVVDTPPPTVSGSLHVGHVFSYTHTDVLARFHRMNGRNVFYPMGWDDNGLPTERRVQNYFNVRCDPHEHYIPNFQPDTSAKSGDHPRKISRPNFIELCLRLTAEDEKVFKALWRRVALSVDWAQEYSTIDDRCRRMAQLSFLDLYRKGHIYSTVSPSMWDVDFQTAVAQAEVEDRPVAGAFHNIRFQVDGSDESFVIATTRPELLPACVGVTAHPNDKRYQHLFGKRAVTPAFHAPVLIFPSELADPEKGTGVLMVCTFGDATDVRWWREQNLPTRQIISRDGRLLPVDFGSPGWDSLDPAAANANYAQIAGKNLKQARAALLPLLGDALTEPPKPLEHSVKFFEKGERPLEFITTRQWFVRLLDKKEKLIEIGDRIQWHPDFMRLRYKTWTENLQFDWCISRQRYFGVSFPVWYRLNAEGEPDYDHPILADAASLPIDPMSATAPGFAEEQRDKPNGFTAETDVFDTWFTSSLTPQISALWEQDPDRFAKLFPADLRPQSHEIIRTWAFYTIVKAYLHSDTIPWDHVGISGWVLDPDRKKMSKSKGNVVTPMHLLDEYGADAVRYWSANARLGTDTAFDTNVLKVGKRLVTKLFNAGKFVLGQAAEPGPITHPLDLAFLTLLKDLVARATDSIRNYDHATALSETERFFWRGLTDNYLELVKARTRAEDDPQGRGSAVATLRLAMNVFLRLFAPFVPYITEEVWSWSHEGSIHRGPWPTLAEFPPSLDNAEELFETAAACLSAINRRKSESNVSVGRAVTRLTLACSPDTAKALEAAQADVFGASRAQGTSIELRDSLDKRAFEVLDIEFESAPATEAP